MRDLSLVQRDDHDQEANSKSSNDAAGVQVVQVLCRGLKSAADTEDNSSKKNSETAAKIVSSRAGEHGAEESAASEDRHYSPLLRRSGHEARLEVGRSHDSSDDAEIISIEDGADRGENGDEKLQGPVRRVARYRAVVHSVTYLVDLGREHHGEEWLIECLETPSSDWRSSNDIQNGR